MIIVSDHGVCGLSLEVFVRLRLLRTLRSWQSRGSRASRPVGAARPGLLRTRRRRRSRLNCSRACPRGAARRLDVLGDGAALQPRQELRLAAVGRQPEGLQQLRQLLLAQALPAHRDAGRLPLLAAPAGCPSTLAGLAGWLAPAG